MFEFLEQRFSVHIKLTALKDHRIPQECGIFIIVVSTYGSLPWYIDWPDTGPRPCVKIRDFVYNLAFDRELTLL